MKESEENKTETFGNEIKTHNAKMFVMNKHEAKLNSGCLVYTCTG
jgi:hypothetical protein